MGKRDGWRVQQRLILQASHAALQWRLAQFARMSAEGTATPIDGAKVCKGLNTAKKPL